MEQISIPGAEAQFLQLTANSASCPCTSQELYRASCWALILWHRKVRRETLPPRLWSHCRRSGANAAKHTGKPRYCNRLTNICSIFPKTHRTNYYNHIKDLKNGSKHEMPSLVRNGHVTSRITCSRYYILYILSIIHHISPMSMII